METKKKLKELKANMPYGFYETFLENSQKLGLTERQFTAVCIGLGHQVLLNSYLSNMDGFLSEDNSVEVNNKITLRNIISRVREFTS
jgi:hypothetical protein